MVDRGCKRLLKRLLDNHELTILRRWCEPHSQLMMYFYKISKNGGEIMKLGYQTKTLGGVVGHPAEATR